MLERLDRQDIAVADHSAIETACENQLFARSCPDAYRVPDYLRLYADTLDDRFGYRPAVDQLLICFHLAGIERAHGFGPGNGFTAKQQKAVCILLCRHPVDRLDWNGFPCRDCLAHRGIEMLVAPVTGQIVLQLLRIIREKLATRGSNIFGLCRRKTDDTALTKASDPIDAARDIECNGARTSASLEAIG